MLTLQQLKSKQKERKDPGTKHTLQEHTPITYVFQLSLALSSFYDLSIALEAKNLPPYPDKVWGPVIQPSPKDHTILFFSLLDT